MTIRCIDKDRDELVQAITEASRDAVIVVAVLGQEDGQLLTSGDPSAKDMVFMGQVITHQGMHEAWGEE